MRAFERDIASGFDIDEFGVARAELTQFPAYRSGIAFVVEEILPLVIRRPPAVAAVIPASDSGIDSGSQRNAVHTSLMPDNQLKFGKRYAFIQNWRPPGNGARFRHADRRRRELATIGIVSGPSEIGIAAKEFVK
jgi:hypothetical protein